MGSGSVSLPLKENIRSRPGSDRPESDLESGYGGAARLRAFNELKRERQADSWDDTG
jgi:hypothetical protein